MKNLCIRRKCARAKGIAGIAHVKFPMMLAISLNEIKFAARAASHMLLTADTFAPPEAQRITRPTQLKAPKTPCIEWHSRRTYPN
jgi:hypothetical protein